MKVKQEWNRQDVSVCVTDRYSTHTSIDLIILSFPRGHVCETDLPENVLHLIPETARRLASKLNQAADRAEKQLKDYLDQNNEGV
jgi:hypothetical protein